MASPAQAAGPDSPTPEHRLRVSYGGAELIGDLSPRSAPPGSWTFTAEAERITLRLTGDGRLLERNNGADWIPQSLPSAPEPLSLLVADFVEACQTGREPETNTVDAMAGVGLWSGAVVSAREGRAVELIHSHYQSELDAAYEKQFRQGRRV